MSVEVVVKKGGEVVQRFLVGSSPIVIGRSPDCDVQLGDPSVSRYHCKVAERDGSIYVEDLGSSNGTEVNGKVLKGKGALADLWRIGDFTFEVVKERTGVEKPSAQSQDHFLRLVEHYYREVLADFKDEGGIDRENVEKRLRELIEDEGVIDEYGINREELIGAVLDEIFEYGVITPLLKDESITEVMVNGPEKIYFERGGKIYRYEKKFYNDEAVRRVIEKIVFAVGRRIDEGSPYVDARLPDGSRFNAVIPPIALDGPTITIRKFFKKRLTKVLLLPPKY